MANLPMFLVFFVKPEGMDPRLATSLAQAGSAGSAIAAQAVKSIYAPDGSLSEVLAAYALRG